MKKYLTLALSALLALSLFACGEPAPNNNEDVEMGTLMASFAEDVDPADYENVVEASADTADVTIALYTDGKYVQSVMLESGSLDESGTEFAPEKAIYGCDQMGPDDLVLVQVPYFETMPNLRLSYTGVDGTVRSYLSQSGKDGSLILIEAE